MSKDLSVKELKVKKSVKVDGYVDVDRHLKVGGSVNLGDKTIVQANSNTNPVTINSASGIITMNDVVTTTSSFVVTNNKVKATSVILVSFASFVRYAPILTVTNVSDGSFTINVDVATGTVAVPAIAFLVC